MKTHWLFYLFQDFAFACQDIPQYTDLLTLSYFTTNHCFGVCRWFHGLKFDWITEICFHTTFYTCDKRLFAFLRKHGFKKIGGIFKLLGHFKFWVLPGHLIKGSLQLLYVICPKFLRRDDYAYTSFRSNNESLIWTLDFKLVNIFRDANPIAWKKFLFCTFHRHRPLEEFSTFCSFVNYY